MAISKDDGKWKLVFRPDPKDVPEIMRRQRLVLGQPFVFLPGRDPYKVLTVIEGHKIRAEDVEMVFNDALLMDFVYRGIGPTSAETDDGPMKEIRALAGRLYGQAGVDAREKYGLICLECGSHLPEHLESCKAGIRTRNQLRSLKAGEN